MNDCQMTFQRYETKYLLNPSVYESLRRRLLGHVREDQYGATTIQSIYYDMPDYRVIRASLQKPVYKEKLRLRGYGIVRADGTVFVELKKKYKGVVYKRRERMILPEAEHWLNEGVFPGFSSQVVREIEWFRSYYPGLCPVMYIGYDRIAAVGVQDERIRVTFDTNIRWRNTGLDLREAQEGEALLSPGWHLMEVKVPGAMPLWMCHILDELHIYPVSFSKYGRAYQNMTGEDILRSAAWTAEEKAFRNTGEAKKKIITTGGIYCA